MDKEIIEGKAKLKAKELIEKFKDYAHKPSSYLIYAKRDEEDHAENAKQCALLTAETVIQALSGVWGDVVARINRSCEDTLLHQKYWQRVKEEILKIPTCEIP